MIFLELGKRDKFWRILYILGELQHEKTIVRKQLAEYFQVDAKTIQRDLEDLRTFLDEIDLVCPGENRGGTLEYVRAKKGYVLQQEPRSWLTEEDVLVVSRILLESRAFDKNELGLLLNKLAAQVQPKERKVLEELLRGEAFGYVPARHSQPLMERIWKLGEAVRAQRIVKLAYQKEKDAQPVERLVEPCSVLFSEYYFYLIAYIHNANHPYPAVYRLDRITHYEVQGEKYQMTEQRRIKDGEFRKHVQFMIPGKLMTVAFKFWGPSVEAVLDRLPTAKIIKEENGVTEIEATIFGEGILMWLLSQGDTLEVIRPPSLREKMKARIAKMQELYQ